MCLFSSNFRNEGSDGQFKFRVDNTQQTNRWISTCHIKMTEQMTKLKVSKSLTLSIAQDSSEEKPKEALVLQKL